MDDLVPIYRQDDDSLNREELGTSDIFWFTIGKIWSKTFAIFKLINSVYILVDLLNVSLNSIYEAAEAHKEYL